MWHLVKVGSISSQVYMMGLYLTEHNPSQYAYMPMD